MEYVAVTNCLRNKVTSTLVLFNFFFIFLNFSCITENGFSDRILGNTLLNETLVMGATGADWNMVCFGLVACIRSVLRMGAFGYTILWGLT